MQGSFPQIRLPHEFQEDLYATNRCGLLMEGNLDYMEVNRGREDQ